MYHLVYKTSSTSTQLLPNRISPRSSQYHSCTCASNKSDPFSDHLVFIPPFKVPLERKKKYVMIRKEANEDNGGIVFLTMLQCVPIG